MAAEQAPNNKLQPQLELCWGQDSSLPSSLTFTKINSDLPCILPPSPQAQATGLSLASPEEDQAE